MRLWTKSSGGSCAPDRCGAVGGSIVTEPPGIPPLRSSGVEATNVGGCSVPQYVVAAVELHLDGDSRSGVGSVGRGRLSFIGIAAGNLDVDREFRAVG